MANSEEYAATLDSLAENENTASQLEQLQSLGIFNTDIQETLIGNILKPLKELEEYTNSSDSPRSLTRFCKWADTVDNYFAQAETLVDQGRLSDEHHKQARIGYRFYKSAWGCGYATEGARALLDWGFAKLELDTIIATTYEYNSASRRVMEKLGLTKYREFKVDLSNQETVHFESDEIWEGCDVEYRITISEWFKLRSLN